MQNSSSVYDLADMVPVISEYMAVVIPRNQISSSILKYTQKITGTVQQGLKTTKTANPRTYVKHIVPGVR
jgi:hypothetical protein